jgi:hypothetical protein
LLKYRLGIYAGRRFAAGSRIDKAYGGVVVHIANRESAAAPAWSPVDDAAAAIAAGEVAIVVDTH